LGKRGHKLPTFPTKRSGMGHKRFRKGRENVRGNVLKRGESQKTAILKRKYLGGRQSGGLPIGHSHCIKKT